jgi:hypothetical protein
MFIYIHTDGCRPSQVQASSGNDSGRIDKEKVNRTGSIVKSHMFAGLASVSWIVGSLYYIVLLKSIYNEATIDMSKRNQCSLGYMQVT